MTTRGPSDAYSEGPSLCPPDDGVGSPGVVAYRWSMPPIDPDATPQTRALLRNLAALEGRHVLFGHQDDLAYGTHWSADDGSPDGRSDVRDVTGAYPSVQGFDVGQVETGADRNVDGLPFVDIRRWVRQAHAGGSVVTVSWHASHLPTGGPTWTRVETIPDLLPGGSHAQAFTAALDRLADFLADLTDDAGRPIPVVFRPYHEHNGEWFWWGRGFNREADFVALWRQTVEHLRDRRGLHHLLYAISPDRSRIDIGRFDEDYLYGYPGDDYVDILGVDDYWDFGHEQNPATQEQQHADLVTTLTRVAQLAQERGKPAVLAEVGTLGGIPDPWTGYLLGALTANADTRRILWTLSWRNPTGQPERTYTPSPGDPAASDLAAYARDPFVLLDDRMPDLYG